MAQERYYPQTKAESAVPGITRMHVMDIVDDRSDGEGPDESKEAPENEPDVPEQERTDDSEEYRESYEAHAYSEYSSTDSDNEENARQALPFPKGKRPAPPPEAREAIRSALHREDGAHRPKYPREWTELLAAYVQINGVKAWTLFDLGSNTDAVSTEFAQICNLDVFELENPVTLKLGCKGSKSKITHGGHCRTALGTINTRWYFDVANIAHYDAVVGLPFCAKHGITIMPDKRTIRLPDGLDIPVELEGGRIGGNDKWARPNPAKPRASFRK
ncbi:hypothetical protein PUNSTDRAFT_130917 [Punctularia strigosozonata HHB-11173 SS5]|uniref:uncharacterized protein n=1 Tax=Punctularia strigosozonata (strain HHB-11173) TaxID=741275 RepID=UPI0004417FA2|nr:uncharacterized protein PUNSTDRAFT_130917 [Punctularia strigosozonata HHB-11173 SS5]EIN12661.1 hypothetical protein PUNSTDRAFT_130917 [Punctularia strigosozonata HHB-11173 SS5]